jgi:V/A-type H+-transporting ATPase subunit F
VEGVVVHEKQETIDALKAVAEDPTVGIILVTEKLAELAREYVDHVKLDMPKKLLVEIPDRHGTIRKKDSITSYVNEAIGLKI